MINFVVTLWPKIDQMLQEKCDLQWMQRALELAEKARFENEVPVGAVVVLNDEIIGEGYNQPIAKSDPTSHAEINALRAAASKIQNYRLLNSTLYVTLEPCAMCIGAMVHARVQRLVFGALDPRAGAVKSVFQIADHQQLNHQISWQGGVCEQPCSMILKDFFREKRAQLKAVA